MKKTLLRVLIPALLLTIVGIAGLTADPTALTIPAATAGSVRTAEAAAAPERLVVPLSKPGQPATFEANIMFGSIKISGYEGKDIIIEATPRAKSVKNDWNLPALAGIPGMPAPAAAPSSGVAVVAPTPRPARAPRVRAFFEDAEKSEKDKQAKAAGLKPVPLAGSGLTVEEEDNVVTLEVESWRQAYDLDVKVPAGTSLKIDGANLDKVVVENVGGQIEIESANGGLKLTNVSGPVVAETTNGDIEVVFSRMPAGKPMSFVTFNGDVDVTLPADAKASFRIKSSMGEVFTDFDLALKAMPAEAEKSTGREGGKYRISLERAVIGSINGGGVEMSLQNYQGNIYIRKHK
ncbi:MAG: DUF4097 family beta strand repeat-containing protein [Acidobacteriota bacterium]|nr:DUF4097 family beta strand repeat-containing protein [Acidobacteriota bacterium]